MSGGVTWALHLALPPDTGTWQSEKAPGVTTGCAKGISFVLEGGEKKCVPIPALQTHPKEPQQQLREGKQDTLSAAVGQQGEGQPLLWGRWVCSLQH